MPAKGRDYKPLPHAEGFRLFTRARDAEIKCRHLEEICAVLLAQLIREQVARETAERRADNLDKRLHKKIFPGRVVKVAQGELREVA
jgi:hypothetical protein